MWSVKVTASVLLTLTQRGCGPLCFAHSERSAELWCGGPRSWGHGGGKEETSLHRAWHQVGGGSLGINHRTRGWTPVLPSVVPQDWEEACGVADTWEVGYTGPGARPGWGRGGWSWA